MPVIEPVTVADVEALLAAIPPNGELHKARKYLREGAVELPSINLLGDQANDFGTAAWPVAAGAIRMGGLEPVQDTSSVQKVVHQGIDRDQVHADFEPVGTDAASADQNAGQCHRQHLIRNPVNIAQWLDQGIVGEGIMRRGRVVGLVQLVINPADQVSFSDIANK